MKTILLLFALVCGMMISEAQEIHKDLKTFKKLVASPHVNVVLIKGDQENIKLVFNNVPEEKINIDVAGKTLHIFLDGARMIDKSRRKEYGKEELYPDASVTAYVTYKNLNYVEIRGMQELTCEDPIGAETFTLKAYGENDISLASVQAEYFKTSLYGENKLHINGGKSEFQKYRLFGENKIDTKAMKSFSTVASIFGESKLTLTSQDHLKITAFGEPEILYHGNAVLSKGIVLGEARIQKFD